VPRSVRPMLPSDKPGIMQILQFTSEFLPEEVVVAEEVLDAYLEYPDSGYFILVVEEENVITGYICYGPTPLTEGTWDIYWMAVTPQKKGKGIGGSLLQLVEKEIKRNKGRLIMIETSSKPDYEPTRGFYLKHKYQQICQIPDYYAPGDDLVIFNKRI